jgi:cytochrome b involved in lipid metabolism/plastocyanin
MTSAYVAQHDSAQNCWLVIENKIYAVTDYVPVHPGGRQAITDKCGTDATVLFTTNGGGGHKHSESATQLLANYYIADLNSVIPGTERVVAPAATDSAVAVVAPESTPAADAPIGVSKFLIGDRVVTTDSLSVRKQAGASGEKLASEVVGTQGTVKSPSMWAEGAWWAYVAYKDGHIGWSSESYLKKYVENLIPTTPVKATETLTTTSVSTHNSRTDCYLIINSKVYDVTQYISFHPGGTAAITNYCGGEATNAFNTKGGGGSHSSNAQGLLANYYIGALGSAEPVTTPTPTTCSTFTYSSWSSCQSNSTQSRTVTASSPSGCTGGSPVTTQSCVYTPPVTTSGGLTSADVATHNSAGDCYLIISSKVYNVTQYIPFHPGGQSRITTRCGTDATSIFNGGSGSHNHSSSARNTLANYYVGDLTTSSGGVTTPTTCSTFTYNSWSSCQSNSTQSRTVTASSPSGCTGGSPVTTQSCVYTPGGATTPQTSTVSVSASGSFSPSSLTIHAGDSIQFVWTGGEADEKNVSFSPSTISIFKMDHENTQFTRVFSSTGTWTFSSSGGTGTVTVQ